jgi:phage terminase large subunit-like protein
MPHSLSPTADPSPALLKLAPLQLAALPLAALLALKQAPPEEKAAALFRWHLWARDSQCPPPPLWTIWLILAGRGWGKTRTGAEWVRDQVVAGRKRIALVAATSADARDVMVEGDSGILSISPPWDRPHYEPSRRRLTWPNGAIATTYSADEPDRLRGPQHDAAWCDEIAAWRYPDAWDMLMFGLRLGENPQVVATTTPRPVPLLKDLMANPRCAITRGNTFENQANLAADFVAQITEKYEGTRLGRQELYAEVLEDIPGALWTMAAIEGQRTPIAQQEAIRPLLTRIVVAIDPPISATETSDECGLIVAGITADGTAYILEDCSAQATPLEWATRAVQAFHHWQADRIVAEVNQGGDMVETILRQVDPNVPYRAVHATRGKLVRAEPIAALYEQNRVSHLGTFTTLEDQMCAFTGGPQEGGSPDRVDALVWALTDLMVKPSKVRVSVV